MKWEEKNRSDLLLTSLGPPMIELLWVIPYRSSELVIIIIELVYSLHCYHSIYCSHFYFMFAFSVILLDSICLLLRKHLNVHNANTSLYCIPIPIDKNMYSPSCISMWRYECESKPHKFVNESHKKCQQNDQILHWRIGVAMFDLNNTSIVDPDDNLLME